MINPLDETVISLQDAAELCPERRGKRPHISCLYRWTSTGCRGVILEWVQVGGTRCTSREALARFIRRLTDLALPAKSGQHCNLTPTIRQTEDVEQQLDAMGM
jgi:hypothetical protein